MGHYCKICDRVRANERFSGKGHRMHICKDCKRMPFAEREHILISSELYGFLEQSIISNKNRIRLKKLMEHKDASLSWTASLIYWMSLTVEGKRKRWRRLREKDWDLYVLCREDGLIHYNGYGYPDPDVYEYEYRYWDVDELICESEHDVIPYEPEYEAYLLSSILG